ncbi:MAG: YajQ family cyclic di-GMP-binding protein [Pseudohongiellaceae bacterium]
MPSFDIVSEVDMHEINNAIDQSNREVGTRFDFKGVAAKFSVVNDTEIQVAAESDFQVHQMVTILRGKLSKRGVDAKSLSASDVVVTGRQAMMPMKVEQGIESDIARKIVKMIKEEKLKVQTAIQGEKLRVTGKKRDDLQQVIAFLKEADLDVPLQFNNFRD